MRKPYLTAAVAVALAGSLTLTSCIGNFTLTHRVLSWNQQVSNKFVNELIFFAFWVLPVYEVTTLVDVLVMNSIEFWSGSNPMSASIKKIDSDHGQYLIACDGTGYDITCPDGSTFRLNFYEDEQTWTLQSHGEEYKLMTFIDADHVKMAAPDGSMVPVELSERGVMAYQQMAAPQMALVGAK